MNYSKLTGFTDEASDSLEEQIGILQELGWRGMELRTIGGKQLVDLTDHEFGKVCDALSEADIEVVSVGSSIADWSQSILFPFEETRMLVRRFIPKIKALGAGIVRIMSYQILEDVDGRISSEQYACERIRRIDWITKMFLDNGIQPVHENCFTYGGLSYEYTLQLLENIPDLKLVFDTGNPPIDVDIRTPFPYSYQDSWEFYRNVKPYIAHVHIKDSYIDDGKEVFTFPGEGNGCVNRIVSDLLESGYDGWFSIEPHMATVFHDKSVASTPEARMDNFRTYAHRFEDMLNRI